MGIMEFARALRDDIYTGSIFTASESIWIWSLKLGKQSLANKVPFKK